MKIDKKRFPFIYYIQETLLGKTSHTSGDTLEDFFLPTTYNELLSDQMSISAKVWFNKLMKDLSGNGFQNNKIVADTVINEFINTKLYLKTIRLLKDLPEISGTLHFKYHDKPGTIFNTSAIYRIRENELKAFFFIASEGKYKVLFDSKAESTPKYGGKFMFGVSLPLDNIRIDLDDPYQIDNNLMGMLAALLLYIEFGEKETVILDEKTGKKKKSNFTKDKFLNEFKLPLQVIDTGYFRKIVYTKDLAVDAYWKNQHYGPGGKERRLQLIGAYERKGYNTHLLE